MVSLFLKAVLPVTLQPGVRVGSMQPGGEDGVHLGGQEPLGGEHGGLGGGGEGNEHDGIYETGSVPRFY